MSTSPVQLGLLLDSLTADIDSADSLSRVMQDFVALVARHGMLHRLRSIETAYREAVQQRLGFHAATIESSRELQRDERTRLEVSLPPQTDVTYLVNPKLQYGIRVTLDGQVQDSSLTGRLARLRHHLS